MEELEEALQIDIDFDVEYAILCALRETIGHNIDEQRGKDNNLLVSRETILSNFIVYNMDKMEEECFCTQGADGKVYACGEWLGRPVRYENKMITTMDYIIISLTRRNINMDKLVFCPGISGADMRKKMWKNSDPTNSSYDIPRSGKDSFGQKREIPAMMGFGPPGGMPPGAGGPPPGMGFGPPGGMPPGAGGPPPGMGFGPPGGMPPGMMPSGSPLADGELEELEEIPEAEELEELEEI